MGEYIGIAVSFVLSAAIAGAIVLASTLGRKNELHQTGSVRVRKRALSLPIGMAIKFYLTAILFILFDVELVFLYPGPSCIGLWGQRDRRNGRLPGNPDGWLHLHG